MRQEKWGDWIGRHVAYPVPEMLNARILEGDVRPADYVLKTVHKYELVWTGDWWPNFTEVQNGLHEFSRRFHSQPDTLVVGFPTGTLFGVEVR